MREKGKIKSIDDEKIVVELNTSESCQSCHLKGCCHAKSGTSRVLHLENTQNGYQPDDWVEIETSPRSFLTAAFLVFLFPILLALIAYFIISFYVNSQKGIMAFWITFVVAELMVVFIDRSIGRKKRFQPRIVSKLMNKQ